MGGGAGCTFAECEEDVWRGADVLHGGCPGADLSPQHVVEDLGGVLLALKVDPMEVAKQHQQYARVVHLLLRVMNRSAGTTCRVRFGRINHMHDNF